MSDRYSKPTFNQLCDIVSRQQGEIEALRNRRTGLLPRPLGAAIVAATAALAISLPALAAGGVSNNVVMGCVAAHGHAVTIAKTGKCGTGTTPLSWNQFNTLAASGPLSVTPGIKGSPPTVALSGVVPVTSGGTGSSSQNFVDLSTDQSISGNKTFTSPVAASITGNAATVTNGVYTNGAYDDPSWLTGLSGSKIESTVGSAQSFTGSLSGDVTGTQGATSVAAIDGIGIGSPIPGESPGVFMNDGHIWIVRPVGTATENGAALQATVSDAGQLGEIFIEPGTYDVSSSFFSVAGYLHLVGAGQNLTVITDSGIAMEFSQYSEIEGVTINYSNGNPSATGLVLVQRSVVRDSVISANVQSFGDSAALFDSELNGTDTGGLNCFGDYKPGFVQLSATCT